MTEYEKLEERIARLERLVEERHYIPQDKPWDVPFVPTKHYGENRCTKCGIKLNAVMGYCCPHTDCPCGMGPSTCLTQY